ncbi:MAG: hypothetical protein ACREOE_07010, partial [Gemmatimonadales bacterium]
MAIFDRSVSRVTGPLACYAAGFSAELGARGYGQDAIYLHLRLIAELSAWLSVQELDAGQLSPAVTDRFVTGIRATCRRLVSARALAPILGYLHDLGVLGEAEAEPANERDALLAAYQQYLRRERGVGERTVHGYAPHAAEFLAGVGDRLDEALRELTGPEVLAILKEQLR